MNADVVKLLPLIQLGVELARDQIERSRQRKLETMGHDEIAEAARELSAKIKPWDAPIEGEPGGGDG